MLRHTLVSLFALLLVMGTGLAPGDVSDHDRITVESLGWMSGTWVKDSDGEYIEESYSPVRDSEMIGMFRWRRGGELMVYEIMVIEETDAGVRMLMRHFSKGLSPWTSEADGPLVYEAVDTGENRVVFLKRASDEDPQEVRVEYVRTGDAMAAHVDTGDGEPFTIRYERKSPQR